jgi:hypothetical protein
VLDRKIRRDACRCTGPHSSPIFADGTETLHVTRWRPE